MRNNSKMEILIECPMCAEEHSVEVEYEDFLDWENGKLAQYAFPYLDSIERDQIITKVCPCCQKEIFGC